MAIQYDLDISLPNDAPTVAAALTRAATQGELLDLATPPSKILGDGVVLRAGMWCRVTVADDEDRASSPVSKQFGIAGTCWVTFREDGLRDRDRQDDEMVWLVGNLLRGLPGDVALHWEYEQVWLVRRGGALLVSDDDEIWTPERLGYLPEPYERVHLAFSEDEGER